MKLIDILVHELPKRGGWPLSAIHSWCDKDGEIRFRGDDCQTDFYPSLDVDLSDRIPEMKFEDSREYVVTREQYEAALAASKPEWDGKGLPPVGCECEFKANDGSWGIGTVLCVGKNRIFWLCHEDGDEYTSELNPQEFRPIRSEADKKRDEAVEAMIKHKDDIIQPGTYYHAIYDAIAAGKIPHIRID